MAKGQKAAPRGEWSQVTRTKQNEWKKKNRSVLATDMPKEETDVFRAICKKENVSVSAALSVFVRAAIQAGTLDIIRSDIPGQKNIDPSFPQGDQASENDTPGTVDSHPSFDTPGTVC